MSLRPDGAARLAGWGTTLIRFLKSFSRWCNDVSTLVVLPLMVLAITADVILRYFFNAPLEWGEEVNGLLLFLLLMLSMTYAWDLNKHIRMEIFYLRLRGWRRTFADVVSGLTGILFFGCLGLQSWRDIDYMRKTNESSEVLHIPLWPFRALLVLISLVFVIKLVHYIFVGRKEAVHEEAALERDGVVITKEVG
ncbi:MAG: TRAP transporter small permease [Proteobacteria bacterium]|nr:TRAP transporter small permease [Pseudomonadota bacterium]